VTELSVVLVNHNGAGCLPAALDALAQNTNCEDAECLVIDSGSTDGSWQRVERCWSKARALRLEENVGFCAGCNRGAAAAAGRLLAFVNFDGRVEPGWDAPLRTLLDDPSVSVATGLLLDPSGRTVEAAGLEIAPSTATYGRLAGVPRSAIPAEPLDVTAASGALMMVRRDEFVALAGFYEPFFMYGEEADYCLRAPGRVVLTPASAIRHEYGHAAGPRFSPLRRYLLARNRLVNAARHLPPAALAKAMLASAAFDAATLASSPSGAATRAVLRGWRDGLAAVPRERAARRPPERDEATKRLVPFRDALAAHRRIPRAP
jgi:N-acetylglucosaminyl-diphospho-decaprenol L-rhamnosyltransferase